MQTYQRINGLSTMLLRLDAAPAIEELSSWEEQAEVGVLVD